MDSGQTTSPAKIEKAEEEEPVPKVMRDAVHRFFFGRDHGPLAALFILCGMMFWRLSLASFGALDVGVFGSSVVFWWFQEHVLHDKVLHSKQDWFGKQIHQEHHDRPYFHISIDPAPLMLGWLLTATSIFNAILPTTELALSASIGYVVSGLIYEWAHYIVHTRVKPPNAFWRRVRDHHMRHHNVNNDYWFSFTVPAIDDIFGTNPTVSQARSIAKRKQLSQTS